MSHFIYSYADCHHAECRYAECRYAECRGAFPELQKHSSLFFKNIVTKIETDNLMKNLTFKERGKGGRQKD